MLAPTGEKFLECGVLCVAHGGSFQTSLPKELVRVRDVPAKPVVSCRCIHYAGEPAARVTDLEHQIMPLQ